MTFLIIYKVADIDMHCSVLQSFGTIYYQRIMGWAIQTQFYGIK